MTSASASSTEPWIESKGARYPYAYDMGGKLASWFGITSIPAAVLIDPSGNIVWRDNPGRLTDAAIEEALEGALTTPMWEWPASAKGVKKALEKRAFAKAINAATKMGEEGTGILEALRSSVTGLVNGLNAAWEAGDYRAVDERGEVLEKELKGLPEADQVGALLDRLKDDKEAQKILKAQRDVAKMMGGRIKKKDVPKFEKRLQEIMEDFSGTAAERDARAGLQKLRKR